MLHPTLHKTICFFITTTLLICGFAFVLHGQQITPEEELDYVVEDFVLPGGRLGNNVNAIVEGPYGFLWFGSHGGLHRYDGYEVITYKNEPSDTIGETTSLSFPYVENLYWDRFDKLWVTTYGEGMYRFDPVTEVFTHFVTDQNYDSSISHNRVMCAGEDDDGELWFGTVSGLNKFDRKTETFKRYFPFASGGVGFDNDFRKLYVDKSGTLWAAAGEAFWNPSTGGLVRYDKESDSFSIFTHQPTDPSSLVSSATRGLLEDSEGNFWVGTTDGLNRMDRDKGTFEFMSFDPKQPHAPGDGQRPTPAVFSLLEDRSEGLWVGTIGSYNFPCHLLRYDLKTSDIQYLPVGSAVWDLCQSSDGTIWVAGAGVSGKVLKIQPKRKAYDLQRGDFYEDAFITSPLYQKLKKSNIDYLGTGSGPINIAFDEKTGEIWGTHVFLTFGNRTREPYPHGILSKYNPTSKDVQFYELKGLNLKRDANLAPNTFGVAGMAVDNEGIVWASYASDSVGLFSFDPGSEKLEHFIHDPNDSTSISSNYIVKIFKDSREELWIGTYEKGLNRFNIKTKEITKYNFTYPDNLPVDDNFPIAIAEDPEGMIWIAGELWRRDTQLMIKFNPFINTYEEIQLPVLFNNASIRSLAFSFGIMAFTIYERGIGFYDPALGTFWFRNTQNGNFPVDLTSCILHDGEGGFWVSTRENGVFIRPFESGENYVFVNKNYEGSLQRRGLVAPNGNLIFMNGPGWDEVDPKLIQTSSVSDNSDVSLVDLYVMGEKQIPGTNSTLKEPLWRSQEIRLPSKAENFGIRFTDFNFKNRNTKYQYRLVPYENTWEKTDNEPVASYFRVPTGAYEFQVRSMNSIGSEENSGTRLKVIILPPWWRTWWAFIMYAISLILGGLFIHRYQKKRTIRIEREKARERELAQAKEIEKAYAELKATQSQLVHAEKMASLGELTAGIAHEIQNPLNFVNNFSEINQELIDEMIGELKKADIEEAISIATDIKANEQKINFHGSRADGIVKGMLMHSRGAGDKVPTNINELADEYFRLAFHGLRARDKTFNASMETDFDPSIPSISIIPQDIGRVILNLITNAFHAVNERKAIENGQYTPSVKLSTSKVNGSIEIRVRDNGSGIDKELKDKIFQPFFTTKPTGKGTGLGLSMSYEIITKGHDGELKVESIPGEGSEFFIRLPNNS